MAFERNDERKRFEIESDGHVAYLTYKQEGSQLELIHTEVPEELEGQGLGGRLARGALAYAREHGLRVTPTCSFVRGWLERHPEEQDVVEQ